MPSANTSLDCCWNQCTTMAWTSSSDLNLWPFSNSIQGTLHHYSQYYGTLQELCIAINKTFPSVLMRSVIVLPDSTHAYVACIVLGSVGLSPISPRPIAVWFPCIWPLLKALKSGRFWLDEDVKVAVMQWFKQQTTELLADGIHWLVHQYLPQHLWGLFLIRSAPSPRIAPYWFNLTTLIH
jgi:hypothetical protein